MKVYRLDFVYPVVDYPIYKTNAKEIKAWVARNPGELASFTSCDSMIDELNRLSKELFDAKAKIKTYEDGLNTIASWGGGQPGTEGVDGSFDEPGSAKTARETLALAGTIS